MTIASVNMLTVRSIFLAAVYTFVAVPAMYTVAVAQADVHRVDDNTEVRRVAFRGNATFDSDALRERVTIDAPSFFERRLRPVTRIPPISWLPFAQLRTYPFSPIELQRDVVRLRRFYNRNGFLHADIDYIASFDEERNRIRIYFTVEEGPPLLIEEVTFRTPEGERARTQFRDEEDEQQWIRFRERLLGYEGRRFTELLHIQMRNETEEWIRNRGYAFAEVRSEARIDTAANQTIVNFAVNAGPRAVFGEIQLEGLERVSPSVVRRVLPFRVGDRFSHRRLSEGQRQIFNLNLFRAALADIPDQPPSDSVTVRYRLREARPRYLSAETGFIQEFGVTLQGRWQHRNFLGGGRDFTASAVLTTGILAFGESGSGYILSTSLRQPYVLIPRLSYVVRPTLEYIHDPAFEVREFRLSNELIYDFYRFRTVSIRHSIATSYSPEGEIPRDDRFYSKNVVGLGGTFGYADDYFNPQQGFLVRPFVEVAGTNIFRSDVQYFKAGTDASGYYRYTRRLGVAGRLFAGRIWPFGESEDQTDPTVRARFRDTRFYAGGSGDVRGWRRQMLGPKDVLFDEDTETYFFRPLGGLGKVAGSTELRMPFPGLGRAWETVAFLDFGNVWEENLVLNPAEFKYGAGGGIRYVTPVGPLRIEVAYMLNPGPDDIRPPEPGAEPTAVRRWAFYLSIGPPF